MEVEVYLYIPGHDFVHEGNLLLVSKCAYNMYEQHRLQIQDVKGLIEVWGNGQWR